MAQIRLVTRNSLNDLVAECDTERLVGILDEIQEGRRQPKGLTAWVGLDDRYTFEFDNSACSTMFFNDLVNNLTDSIRV